MAASTTLYITSQGRRKLENDVKHLENYRRILSRQIHDVWRMDQDRDLATTEILAEEYVHTKSQLEKIIDVLTRAVDIRHRRNRQKVEIGSQVVLANAAGEQLHYRLVGTIEANPQHGLISDQSPVGQALLGKKLGDRIEITNLSGENSWQIKAVA